MILPAHTVPEYESTCFCGILDTTPSTTRTLRPSPPQVVYRWCSISHVQVLRHSRLQRRPSVCSIPQPDDGVAAFATERLRSVAIPQQEQKPELQNSKEKKSHGCPRTVVQRYRVLSTRLCTVQYCTVNPRGLALGCSGRWSCRYSCTDT